MTGLCNHCPSRLACQEHGCKLVQSRPFVYRGEPRTKRDRINRLRERLNAAETVEQLRSVMQGLLDLLGDEL